MSGKSKQQGQKAPRSVAVIPLRISTGMVREAARKGLGLVWNEADALKWLKSTGADMLRRSITGFLPEALKAAIKFSKDEATRKELRESEKAGIQVVRKKPVQILGVDGRPLHGRS